VKHAASLLVLGLVLATGTSARATGTGETAATPRAGDASVTVDKAECVRSLDRAQSLQSQRKLRAARASYLACSAPSCPDLVREDCTRSLVGLDAAMPTVVFSARDGAHDVADVRVLLDGEAVSSALDGHAVAIDPGNHVARFERLGGGAMDVRLVAREGEKNRAVNASFGATAATSPGATRAEGGRFPVVPVILGGTGLLSLASSFYLRMDANATADEAQRTCAPTCDPSIRDSLSDKLVVANVALGVGLGALALAAATWLFDPRH